MPFFAESTPGLEQQIPSTLSFWQQAVFSEGRYAGELATQWVDGTDGSDA